MSKQVMEQALEALLLRKNTGLSKTYDSMAEDAIAALKEAIKQAGEPVAYRITTPDGITWIGAHPSILPKHTSEPLFTAAPSIPEGWQLVPKEPTEKMLEVAYLRIESEGISTTPWLRGSIYRTMLSAAPSE